MVSLRFDFFVMVHSMLEQSSQLIDPQRIEILEPEMAHVLRALTPVKRLAIAFSCNRTVRLRWQSQLHKKHPEWSDQEIQQDIARRLLGGTV